MDVITLREKLHDYIDAADEQHLSAIYVLVEGDISPLDADIFDEKTMDMLYKRRDDHRKGLSKSYTAEESFSIIRQQKKSNDV